VWLFHGEGLTVLLVPLLSDPNVRGFSCSDDSIRLPYKEDTIPTWALGVAFIVGGIALVPFCFIFWTDAFIIFSIDCLID